MIRHLKVKNVNGMSYEMHFESDRPSNTVMMEGTKLLNNYYVTSNGNVDHNMVFLPLLIVTTDSADLLVDAASKLIEGEEAVIELSMIYEHQRNYENFEYKLIFTNDGIIDEIINNKSVRDHEEYGFERSLDEVFMRFFNEQILIIDFKIQTMFDKCLSIAEQQIGCEGYNRFLVEFLRTLNFEVESIDLNRSRDDDNFINNVSIKYNGGYEIDLRTEEPAFQRLFVAGMFLLMAFSSGSTIFFSSLEEYVPTEELTLLIDMVRSNHSINGEQRKPCQLVMATSNIDIVGQASINTRGRFPTTNSFKIFKEQVMAIQVHNNITYYHWHKRLF